MELKTFLKKLGYADSANYLSVGTPELDGAPGFGHIFRHAAKTRRLKGVYALKDMDERSTSQVSPLVYVCEADDEAEAEKTHQLVWNQDIVPFIIVYSPNGVRLYSGFRYRSGKHGATRGVQEGVLSVLRAFNDIDELVEDFHADAIDSGAIWRKWGKDVTPDERLEWNLLDNLKTLDRWLQDRGGLKQPISHALIGKYVYLHYLRDRGILSPAKLQRWNLRSVDIFGRDAKRASLVKVIAELDEWLNGGVFPIDFASTDSPKDSHVQLVASVFAGDELQASGSRQLHFDFSAYDFSYIPIETLSVVYEQFLHDAPEEQQGASRGKDAGAYYTPIPVVNFMLAEVEDRKPMTTGMRILDPSCGSGAFLVQCYRRLIEREHPPGSEQPSPKELRELLERHIFGIDRDPDACSVTELSLTLTLLNYVHPPDLEDHNRRTKLPCLRDQNIFCADFFETEKSWHEIITRRPFDWIVGNPPWKKLKSSQLKTADMPAWRWMKPQSGRSKPVGKYEVAEAFAWEVRSYLAEDGFVALLLPAMSLFETPSRQFRREFFRDLRVHSVANFSNLAEVLFAGRSRLPAAAFFYSQRRGTNLTPKKGEYISIFSPLVANQEPTRPVAQRTRNDTWSLVLNASEIRELDTTSVLDGSGLAWKLASWGSHLDAKLLAKLNREFPSLGRLESDGLLIVSQGLELRRSNGKVIESPTGDEVEREPVEPLPEVIGKDRLMVNLLDALEDVFTFPDDVFEKVDTSIAHVRKGRAGLPLSICEPPHVIVSAARNFAIYSDKFLIVPPRQIGIVSPSKDKNFLKALSLFLGSDFAYYHQFLVSPQLGVQRARATLGALRELPVPIHLLSRSALDDWAKLHDELVSASATLRRDSQDGLFTQSKKGLSFEELIEKRNQLVFSALRLNEREQALVVDLVRVRLQLRDGKIGALAVNSPTESELKKYAKRLRADLDAFVSTTAKHHVVEVVYDSLSAMVQVELVKGDASRNGIDIVRADKDVATELVRTRKRLRKKRSQWVYFDRNLRVYEGRRTFIFKPMQRFHWTETQAMFDAGEIIAETLAGPGVKP